MNKTWERNTAGLMAHARSRKETKRKRVEETITALLREHKAVNFNAVATAAGVSKAYLYSQPQLRERIEALRHQELEQKVRERATPSAGKTDASMAQHRLDNLIEHITGTENRYLLFEGGKGVQRCVPDSPDWFAWLTQLNSFHFQGKSGHFTARQERKQRGKTYWYAYRKAHKRRLKRYLGTTEKLTLAYLEQTAYALHEAVPTLPFLPTVSRPPAVPVSRLPQRRDRVPFRCGPGFTHHPASRPRRRMCRERVGALVLALTRGWYTGSARTGGSFVVDVVDGSTSVESR